MIELIIEIKCDIDVDKAMDFFNINGVRIGESLENIPRHLYNPPGQYCKENHCKINSDLIYL